jgi:hypothetical protein
MEAGEIIPSSTRETLMTFSVPRALALSITLAQVLSAQAPTLIFNSQVMVEPNTAWYLNFDVNASNIPNPVLVGQFEAVGGDGNDIEVIVALRDEFLNWINGHGGRILYSSGKRTTGNIRVNLPASGQYVVGSTIDFRSSAEKL